MSRVLVAGIQLCPRSGSVAENLDRAKEQVRRAAREGARIACLPEYFATGCFTLDASLSGRRLAEDLSGPTVSAMREVAAGEGTGIIAPIFERAGDSFYSAAVVIDGSGTIVGAYRKQHLPPVGALEQRYFSPGNLGNPVFVLSGLAVGVCLCHDRHFFEIARIHALKGSQVLFVPAAVSRGMGRGHLWLAELTCLAGVNGIYTVGVNSNGWLTDGRRYSGETVAVDPLGSVVGQLGEGEGFVLVDVDPQLVQRVQGELRTRAGFRRDLLHELDGLY